MTRILIVDDEEILARTIAQFLNNRGYEASYATDEKQAWQMFEQLRPMFCLIDYRLRAADGVALLARMKTHRPSLEAIIMTGYGDLKVAVAAMKAGARDFLVKPVPLPAIDAIVSEVLRKESAKGAVSGASGILGRSSCAVEIRAAISRTVRATRHVDERLPSVLITGESGTGKDLVARAIHQDGVRADGPLVCVNCASLPADLVESELFGHVKGAFTDARSDKTGLFEAAHNGILFLDEIGDMPLAAQAKLLRVLESQNIRRVGSNQDINVNVWVVAATNQCLSARVTSGMFRADLMFRLQVLWIEVPPLRARDSDVLLLANRFLEEFALKYDSPVTKLSAGVRASLLSHPWPGNVRELRNVIERAVLQCREDQLLEEHLQFSSPPISSLQHNSDPTTLTESEVKMLNNALEKTNGNVTRAAGLLGISRDTLRYRMEKYGLSRNR